MQTFYFFIFEGRLSFQTAAFVLKRTFLLTLLLLLQRLAKELLLFIPPK